VFTLLFALTPALWQGPILIRPVSTIKTDFPSPPVVLTIAGSDSSAGAGIQADLKTFAAHGVYGINALTAVVAETPGAVAAVFALDPTLLHHQLKEIETFFPLAAAKTGMLANGDLVEVVIDFFEANRGIPLVIDPVIRAGTGTRLLDRRGLEQMKTRLFPLARLVTPNLPEAEVLLGTKIDGAAALAAAPRQLSERYGCDFLVKGGHLDKGDEVTDHAWIGREAVVFSRSRLAVPDVHGTGCTLSAAITAQLAQGREMAAAIRRATKYLAAALAQHYRWTVGDRTIEALKHFPDGVDFT
jgi:hydroxymethylpyrimidine/phosphomethylpyrimidine kinase